MKRNTVFAWSMVAVAAVFNLVVLHAAAAPRESAFRTAAAEPCDNIDSVTLHC